MSDVPKLGREETLGEVLVFVVTTMTAGAFFVVRESDDNVARLVTVLEGILVGLVLSGMLLFAWAYRPTAWRRHWRVRNGLLDGESDGFALLSLQSRHWHTVINLTCVVTDPHKNRWRATWKPPHSGPAVLLAPGHAGGPLLYPREFGAPWPSSGSYRVTWLTNVEDSDLPIKIARSRWKIQNDQPRTVVDDADVGAVSDMGRAASPAVLIRLRELRSELHLLEPKAATSPLSEPMSGFWDDLRDWAERVRNAIPASELRSLTLFDDEEPPASAMHGLVAPSRHALDQYKVKLDGVISYLSSKQGLDN